MFRIRRLAAVAVVGGAVAVAVAPAADASPVGYLAALQSDGITIYDPVAAVTAGYRICNDLDTHTGDVTVYRIYNTFYDVTSLEQATSMLFAAVENLCQWQDHRGQVNA
jgi:hypothetical protein